jgi:hypothetical protein
MAILEFSEPFRGIVTALQATEVDLMQPILRTVAIALGFAYAEDRLLLKGKSFPSLQCVFCLSCLRPPAAWCPRQWAMVPVPIPYEAAMFRAGVVGVPQEGGHAPFILFAIWRSVIKRHQGLKGSFCRFCP